MKRSNRIITAALAAAVLVGCSTTPHGIVIKPGAEYGAKWAGASGGVKRPRIHGGVDYAKALGSKVLAAADGIVTKATHSTMRDKRFQCLRNVRIKHTRLAGCGSETDHYQ